MCVSQVVVCGRRSRTLLRSIHDVCVQNRGCGATPNCKTGINSPPTLPVILHRPCSLFKQWICSYQLSTGERNVVSFDVAQTTPEQRDEILASAYPLR